MEQRFQEEWEDKHVQEWLKSVEKREGIDERMKLENEYLHWDLQLYKANEREEVTDINGKAANETEVHDKLADIVYRIWKKANK